MSNVNLSSDEVQKAFRELANNPTHYYDLIKELSSRDKSVASVVEKTAPAIREAQSDYQAVQPVLAKVVTEVKDGVQTSEFKEAAALNKFLMLLGFLAPVIEGALAYAGETSFGNSVWISGAAMVLKTLNTMSYTSGRSKVKVAQAQAVLAQ